MNLSKSILEEIINPEGSLGILRADMPQIDGNDIPLFLKYLKKEKCEFKNIKIPAKDLRPSQGELDTDKADKIWNEGKAFEHPIFVSQDNFVLDGHHRWLAVSRNDADKEMNCIQIMMDVKDCLEIMHGFEKVKKIDIEDNVVESLAKQIMCLLEDDNLDAAKQNMLAKLQSAGFEGISVSDIEVDEEDECVFVSFYDDGKDDTELVAVFFNDEEEGPVVTVLDSDDDFDKDEVDAISLKEFNPPMTANGLIDFSKDLSWLSDDLLEEILTFDPEDSEEIGERSITVIRGGKRVKKTIVRKKRKKRLSAKRKLSIRRAVRKRKMKKRQTQKKRKRSLKIRKRAGLKAKPKNQRVVG